MKNNKSYIIIDDDDIIAFLHPAVINRVDPQANIEVYNDAIEALNFLNELKETNETPPDFIFLDINMPFINGFEFVAALNKDLIDYLSFTKIIMLSSSIDTKDLERAKNEPLIRDFISKPLNVEYLSNLLGE